MMTARERAEQLRQQAIQTLLEEKEAIDAILRTLGYDEKKAKRRGRPPKQEGVQEVSLSLQQQDDPPLPQDQA